MERTEIMREQRTDRQYLRKIEKTEMLTKIMEKHEYLDSGNKFQDGEIKFILRQTVVKMLKNFKSN